MNENRRPRGAPDSTGGQFAPGQRDEQTVPLAEPVRYLEPKESAAALRSDLRSRFRDAKVSVRLATGTAYGWADVSWTDGPRDRTVKRIAFDYQATTWDGMDELYRHVNTDQNPRHSLHEVLTRRDIGPSGQNAIDTWLYRADVVGFEKTDPESGERGTGIRGYEYEQPLTDEQCIRLGLPLDVASHYPCVGTAAQWYHRRLDLSGDKPVFDRDL